MFSVKYKSYTDKSLKEIVKMNYDMLIQASLESAEEAIHRNEWDDERTVVYTSQEFISLTGISFEELIEDNNSKISYIVKRYPLKTRYHYVLTGVETEIDDDGDINYYAVETYSNIHIDESCELNIEDIEIILDELFDPQQQSFSEIGIQNRAAKFKNIDDLEILASYPEWIKEDFCNIPRIKKYTIELKRLGKNRWNKFKCKFKYIE